MSVLIPPKITVGKDNTFVIEFSSFYAGFSPAAHLNSLTEIGNGGHASDMKNVDILDPTYLSQGPALSDLTNGTQAGVVTELINFILDQPTASNQTYGIGATKLFRITPTTVDSGGTSSWPQTVTDMTDGESLILLKGNVYGFYNKTSGGDILKMPISTEVIDPDWGSTTPSGAGALQKAIHPVAKKEDLMVFGNGRYVGYYNATSDTLDVDKLDFGNDAKVADVIFNANQWLIAVNYGIAGTNRTRSEIYFWNGSAVSSLLTDETAVGLYKIGFLFPIAGVVFVAYQDLSFSGGYQIGYINGRELKSLGHFTGALPTFAQKTLYKKTILFISSALVWSCGAVIDDLPYQISQIADGGHATVGAIASPFGTPMIASTDGSANHRLAKFGSTYDITGYWKSVIASTIFGKMLGYIDDVIVITKALGENAKCLLKFEYNQAESVTTAVEITGTGVRRHLFDAEDFDFTADGIEDIRLFLDYSSGNATNPCPIKKVYIKGHFIE